MAFNGSGAFVRLYNWVNDRNAAIKIRADRMDAEMDGMATGLSTCITRDGQSTVTADIPFNNKRITGLGDATAGTDALNSHYLASMCQCELVYTSTSLLTLNRKNGTRVFINGALEQIPTTAPTLNVSGASVGTLYYIYAYMNSGTMTLEYSTTAPAADSTYGHQIKTGDATRTLVGMARPITGPAWVDSSTKRLVRSYFNRRAVTMKGSFTASRDALVGFAEVNTEIRVEFLMWADEAVDMSVNGYGFMSGSSYGLVSATVDGRIPGTAEASAVFNSDGSGIGYSGHESGLSQGYHYATVMGGTIAGTLTFDTAGTGAYTSLNVRVG